MHPAAEIHEGLRRISSDHVCIGAAHPEANGEMGIYEFSGADSELLRKEGINTCESYFISTAMDIMLLLFQFICHSSGYIKSLWTDIHHAWSKDGPGAEEQFIQFFHPKSVFSGSRNQFNLFFL